MRILLAPSAHFLRFCFPSHQELRFGRFDTIRELKQVNCIGQVFVCQCGLSRSPLVSL